MWSEPNASANWRNQRVAWMETSLFLIFSSLSPGRFLGAEYDGALTNLKMPLIKRWLQGFSNISHTNTQIRADCQLQSGGSTCINNSVRLLFSVLVRVFLAFKESHTHSSVKNEWGILLKRVFLGTCLNKCNVIRQMKNGLTLYILNILGSICTFFNWLLFNSLGIILTAFKNLFWFPWHSV